MKLHHHRFLSSWKLQLVYRIRRGKKLRLIHHHRRHHLQVLKLGTVEVKANNPNEIYKDVDQSAEYPGGMGALRKFLGDNFDTSLMEGGEGTLKAKLKFVVEKDGTVSECND